MSLIARLPPPGSRLSLSLSPLFSLHPFCFPSFQYLYAKRNSLELFLINIGFFNINVWDVLDILITGYLLYSVYRLLRGSIAINIVIGVVLLYAIWWLVNSLNMDLLSLLLGQFVSVGVIVLIIIFQPEVRRFLLVLGNTTLKRRSKIFGDLLSSSMEPSKDKQQMIMSIKSALVKMSKNKLGALIVLTNQFNLVSYENSGTYLDAKISQPLLESIFKKDSPIHDGAVIIVNGRIHSASAVLPVSENQDLPKSVGLRHRAGVGATENTSAISLIVSEETGQISYAREGRLVRNLTEEELYEVISRYYNKQ